MAVKLTSKFRVTIPKAVRDQLGIEPGTKFEVVARERGRITLIPSFPRRRESSQRRNEIKEVRFG